MKRKRWWLLALLVIVVAAGVWYYQGTGREQSFVIQSAPETASVVGPDIIVLSGGHKIAMRFHSPADAQILQGRLYADKASRPESEIVISVCDDQNGKLGYIARTRRAALRIKAHVPEKALESYSERWFPQAMAMTSGMQKGNKAEKKKENVQGHPIDFYLPCHLEKDKNYWLVVESGWKFLYSRFWQDDYISLLADRKSHAPAVKLAEERVDMIPSFVKKTEEPEFGYGVYETAPPMTALATIQPERGRWRPARVTAIWPPVRESKIADAASFPLNYRVKLFRKFHASASGYGLQGVIYVGSIKPNSRGLVISLVKNKPLENDLKLDEVREKYDVLDFTSDIRLASTRVTAKSQIGEKSKPTWQRIPFTLYYPGLKGNADYWLMLEPGWNKPDSAVIEVLCGQGKPGESFWRRFEREVRNDYSFDPSGIETRVLIEWPLNSDKPAALPAPDSNTFFLGELALLQKGGTNLAGSSE